MNFKIYLVALLLFFSINVAFSQIKTDTTYQIPVAEKNHYRVYYNLGNFWVHGAEANITTDTLTFENKKSYKFYVEAFTRRKYNWIYSLEDHYTSITDIETFKPLKFEKYNIEKKIIYHNIYDFDWEENVVKMLITQSDQDTIKKTEKLPDFITDAFSAVHYLRIIDFNSYKKGDVISYMTILDGKMFKQKIVYEGEDVITDKKGNKHKTFLLTALIKNSTFFSKKDGVKVWITNDDKRLIAKVNAKIIVGSIIVFLNNEKISFDNHSFDNF